MQTPVPSEYRFALEYDYWKYMFSGSEAYQNQMLLQTLAIEELNTNAASFTSDGPDDVLNLSADSSQFANASGSGRRLALPTFGFTVSNNWIDVHFGGGGSHIGLHLKWNDNGDITYADGTAQGPGVLIYSPPSVTFIPSGYLHYRPENGWWGVLTPKVCIGIGYGIADLCQTINIGARGSGRTPEFFGSFSVSHGICGCGIVCNYVRRQDAAQSKKGAGKSRMETGSETNDSKDHYDSRALLSRRIYALDGDDDPEDYLHDDAMPGSATHLARQLSGRR
eukprot:TRINITY_DN12528_c0_g1_i1.p1 TRINITY_DN12528_c0_g1~~TRINITY_DN12528_c0_g1_i1.p1  ORF type:complete len:319 (-),score=43.50 TRINITY_DN12528_c0_g1_i1:432-1271(-)